MTLADPDGFPEVRLRVETSGAQMILNLTPDAYNALINIYDSLMPMGRDVIQQRADEKAAVLAAAVFQKQLLVTGVKGSAQASYLVVLSGSYLYFFLSDADLTPHYVYLASFSAAEAKGQVVLSSGRRSEQYFFDTDKGTRKELLARFVEKLEEFGPSGDDEYEDDTTPHKKNF